MIDQFTYSALQAPTTQDSPSESMLTRLLFHRRKPTVSRVDNSKVGLLVDLQKVRPSVSFKSALRKRKALRK